MAELSRHGFAVLLVSNQSGIGRGVIAPHEAEHVHQELVRQLAEHGARLDAVYYGPHTPDDGCNWRKPAAGMLLQAARELDIDLTASFMVGDKPLDVAAGRSAGCRTILLSPSPPSRNLEEVPQYVAGSWPETLVHILARLAGDRCPVSPDHV